ncbi:MAG: hypothetical protein C0475_07025, partial [Planctomyces sp.]|nr:hypothetical protein [Planctomyces sp.]
MPRGLNGSARRLWAACALLSAASGSLALAGPGADEALSALTEGNARFAAGQPEHINAGTDRVALTARQGQTPMAAIVSCADSRVPIERVFDRGVGDIFAVRVAGNVAGPDEIGSVEYAVEHLRVPVIVVMGHSSCGAVAAAVSGTPMHGAVGSLVGQIAPAVRAARAAFPDATEKELLAHAVNANVEHSMRGLLSGSEAIRAALESGSVELVGAVYDLATGQVRWIGPLSDQAELIARGDAEPGTPSPAHAHVGAVSSETPAHAGASPTAAHAPEPQAAHASASTPAAYAEHTHAVDSGADTHQGEAEQPGPLLAAQTQGHTAPLSAGPAPVVVSSSATAGERPGAGGAPESRSFESQMYLLGGVAVLFVSGVMAWRFSRTRDAQGGLRRGPTLGAVVIVSMAVAGSAGMFVASMVESGMFSHSVVIWARVGVGLVSPAVGVWIAASVRRRSAALSERMSAIAGGDLARAPLGDSTADELGACARSTDAMQQSLAELMKKLSAMSGT